MPLVATKPPRELIPQGSHIARCIGLVHIGTYASTDQSGKPDQKNEIRLTFEFPDVLGTNKEGDKLPLILSQGYRLSMGPKANLRKIVEGMIGTSLDDEEAYAFDTERLVGMPCAVVVKHKTSKKGSKYETIASVAPLMKDQVAKEASRPYKILTYDKWDEVFFQSLPEFLRKLMESTEEFSMMMRGDETPKTEEPK